MITLHTQCVHHTSSPLHHLTAPTFITLYTEYIHKYTARSCAGPAVVSCFLCDYFSLCSRHNRNTLASCRWCETVSPNARRKVSQVNRTEIRPAVRIPVRLGIVSMRDHVCEFMHARFTREHVKSIGAFVGCALRDALACILTNTLLAYRTWP